MKAFAHPALIAATFTVISATGARAYGPLGHEIVGAIADERLANTATAARLRTLLDGLTGHMSDCNSQICILKRKKVVPSPPVR